MFCEAAPTTGSSVHGLLWEEGVSMGWTQNLLEFFSEFHFQQRAHTNQDPPSAALTQADKTVTHPTLWPIIYKQQECLHRNQVYNGMHSRCRIRFSRKAICSQDLALTWVCTSNTYHSTCFTILKITEIILHGELKGGLRRKDRATYVVIQVPKQIPC